MTMNDPTVVAQSLYLEGRTADAESLYRKILSEHPDDCGALEGLGVLLVQGGGAVEAVGLFSRGLAIQPDSPRLHANLGEVLRLLGRLDEAMAHLRRATELDPAFAQSWSSLGLLAHSRGHYEYAETAHREALRLRPNFAPTHINLANTLLGRGRMNDAADELRRALEISPHHGVALMNLGRVLAEMREPGRIEEAEALARRAVELMPGLPYAMSNLAHVLRLGGRTEEAKAWDEQADAAARGAAAPGRAAPPPPERGRPDEERRIEAEGGHSPQSPPHDDGAEARHVEGLVSMKDGRLDEAEASFREALRLDPTRTASWLKLARIQEERGDFELSCESARSALAVSPKLAEAYGMLAFILKGRLPDAEFRAMQGLVGDPEVSHESRAPLRFGLAAVLDDRGLFAEAASQLESANALQSSGKAARGLAFDHDKASRFLERTIAAFTPEFLARRRGWGDPDPRPVFVVGLPRSGTTLTEQILASHARVHGAGELHEVLRIFQSLPAQIGQPALDPIEALDRLTPELTLAAARSYLALLDSIAPLTAARVVNKQPDNIDLLGMIALLWPGARVILCHRDPRDVALSCWQMGFMTNPWSNDWGHIARRFADYQRVLEHWRRTEPVEWLDISYELLVSDLEGQARRMIDFLGLEWDPACLEFHANRRVVRTPSLVQVRQPIHTRSVGRWRNYEPFIQPLFRAFERYGVDLSDSVHPGSKV